MSINSIKIIDASSKFGKIFYSIRKSGEKFNLDLSNIPWHFYVKRSDVPTDLIPLIKQNSKSTSYQKEFIKIVCENNDLNKWDLDKGQSDQKTKLLSIFRSHNIKTYEADIPLYKRWILDNGIGIDPNPVVCYFDIETDDRIGNIQIGRDRIVSFAFNVNGKDYFYSDQDEYKILIKLKKMFETYDVFCGWNSENFDVPYIRERFKVYNIKFFFNNIIHIDLMELFKKKYKYSDQEAIVNFNLENISQKFLGEGKVKHLESIWWLFTNDVKRLGMYNKQDTRLLWKLDSKLGMTKLVIDLCVTTGCIPRTNYISELVDYLILGEAKKLGKILPSSEYKLNNSVEESEKQKYLGAYVFPVTPGLYKNVYAWDFNSMYPNMIRTFNIGIDTYLGQNLDRTDTVKTVNNCHFDSSYESIVSICCKSLLDGRDLDKLEMKKYNKDSIEYKTLDNNQNIKKILANSVYGAIGSTYTRYYVKELAEAITMSARDILEWTCKWLTSNNGNICLMDTDSAYAQIDSNESPDSISDRLINDLKTHLISTYNVKNFTIGIKLDKIHEKLLILVKKCYSSLVKGEVLSKGLDYVRSDCLKYAGRVQKDLLNEILIKSKPTSDLPRLIQSYKDQFYAQDINKENLYDFVIHERVTKNPSEYKSKSVAVQVAKDMIAAGKAFYRGLMVPYIVTGEKDGLLYGIHPDDFKGELDRDYLWSHQILPKLTRICEVLDPEHDWEQYDPNIMRSRELRLAKYKKMISDIDKYDKFSKKLDQDKLLSKHEKKILLEFFNKNKVQRLW